MKKVNEVIKTNPSVRVIPFSSGCSETDSKNRPFEVWCGGSTLTAERVCDRVIGQIGSLGHVMTKRIGPRSFKVSFR